MSGYSLAKEYQERREDVENLRRQLDSMGDSDHRVIGGLLDLDALERLIVDREAHYRGVDEMTAFIESGGPQSLGDAMTSDFARLRRMNE